jgi:hypothetical protein
MKKILLSFVLVLLIACTTTPQQPQQPQHIKSTPDYTLFDLDSYQILIGKNFEYVDKLSYDISLPDAPYSKVKSYIFTEKSKSTSRLLEIRVFELKRGNTLSIKDTDYSAYDKPSNIKGVSTDYVERGYTDINNIRVPYLIRKTDENYLTVDITNLISSQGYILANGVKSGSNVRLNKIIDDSQLVEIIYYENGNSDPILNRVKSVIEFTKS